jgi:hypothetical protein
MEPSFDNLLAGELHWWLMGEKQGEALNIFYREGMGTDYPTKYDIAISPQICNAIGGNGHSRDIDSTYRSSISQMWPFPGSCIHGNGISSNLPIAQGLILLYSALPVFGTW